VTPPERSSTTPAWVEPFVPDFEDLLRVVELSEGFVLQPVEVAGPDLARALAHWLAARGHPAVVREPQDDAEWKDITGWLLEETARPPNGVIMVIGSREPPEGVFLGLRLTNERRDVIAKTLRRPLFWCGPASFLRLTAQRAPDFWSVRAVERRLKPAAKQEAVPAPAVDLLEEALRQGDRASAARLALQRARDGLWVGKLDEVDAVLDQVLTHPGALDEELESELLFLKAETTRRRGNAQAAIKLLHVLEGREVMDSLRSRCKILQGRAYENSGDLQKAQSYYQQAKSFPSDNMLHELAGHYVDAGYIRRGEVVSHVEPVERRRRFARIIGDRPLEALATALLAEAAARAYDRERAKKLISDARALLGDAGRRPTVLLGGEVDEALAAAEHAIASGSAVSSPSRALLDLPQRPDADVSVPGRSEHRSRDGKRQATMRAQFSRRLVVSLLSLVSFTIAIHVMLGKDTPTPRDAGSAGNPSSIDGGSTDRGSPEWCFMSERSVMHCAPTSDGCEALRSKDREHATTGCFETFFADPE
jgi:tetratricopeptide (TPR) repeat protein